MRELKENELKEIKELEKLSIDELKEELAKIKQYQIEYIQEARRKTKIIDTTIKAHQLIAIYKKEGFEGVYKIIDFYNRNSSREGYQEDDIPF